MSEYEPPAVDELGDVETVTEGAGFSGVDSGSQASDNPNVNSDGLPGQAQGP